MRRLAPIARKVFGLFVDDGRFALIILLWLAIAALSQRLVPLPSSWRGVELFAGLAVALIWSCLHHIARSTSGISGNHITHIR
jgi:hypothetical protein